MQNNGEHNSTGGCVVRRKTTHGNNLKAFVELSFYTFEYF